jgi:hypothetical protein
MKEIKTGTRQQGISTAEIFTYILIALIIPVVIFGMFQGNKLDNSIAEALALGEEQKVSIEEYFQTRGQMPQFEAEVGLEKFTPVGVLADIVWRPGVLGDSASDTLLTGTLKGVLDLSDFGERFEKYQSGYLLVAKAQEDGTIVWDCMTDSVTPDALPGRYLPESCKRASDSDG